MNSGSRILINIDTGGEAGHMVVMKKIVAKSVTKIDGNVLPDRLIYYVMDPARGNYHTISRKSIIGAKNIFNILP